MTFYFVQGDDGAGFEYTIIDPNTGQPQDLSGVVDTVSLQYKNASTGSGEVIVASILGDGTTGEVRIDFSLGDLATPGRYIGEFRIVTADYSKTHYPIIDYIIRPSIDGESGYTPPAGDVLNSFTCEGTITTNGLIVNGASVFLGAFTFGGPLILTADPTSAYGAATKQYVDAAIAAAL